MQYKPYLGKGLEKLAQVCLAEADARILLMHCALIVPRLGCGQLADRLRIG
jgi:hypothetical protein